MNMRKTIMLLLSIAILSACSSMGKKGARDGAHTNKFGRDDSAMRSDDMYVDPTKTDDRFSDDSNLLSQRVIYFDFDNSQVTAKYQSILKAHAEFLAANKDAKVILEGHADERGSREYNIALGEQRSKSASRIMKKSSAKRSQLEPVSYGEEKPVDKSTNEEAWKLNRRVVIRYVGK